ncbi:PTS sugar transporter subunit IIA [Brochothrix campestris]|uniref:PTS system cellobiose-specific transporter subunit IIA n=1 Tax=Brochothrix campestris FSL F6-1037 TaxID=1265861 RepID=W7D9F5_9LIST|nr:fructose PTS transporter subunit IIA [Brochothrix campestris]EUJ41878.1 PTS system cellobiose-specific transporter subunit IIA [Brochothrix campestris FSL F6-1037]
MNPTIFNETHLLFDETATTQAEAFQVIAHFAYERGYVTDETGYKLGLQQRESEATTGFKDHLAIPHSQGEFVIKPGLFLVRFKHPIDWQALDGKAIHVAFALTIPNEGAAEHLKLLSLIARRLIDAEFRSNVLHEQDPVTLAALINEIDF